MAKKCEIEKWCPYQSLAIWPRKGVTTATDPPRLRLLCFHSAGSDGTMFLSRMLQKKSVKNSLVDFCTENGVQLLCPLLPGRSYRLKESMGRKGLREFVKEIYADLNPIFHEFNVPYILCGHSMGGLFVYELLRLIFNERKAATTNPPCLPYHSYITAGIPPMTPKDKRPWVPVDDCDSEDIFKKDCIGFGVQTAALDPKIWPMVSPIIKQDMRILDWYETESKVEIPDGDTLNLTYVWCLHDTKITEETVEGWRYDSFDYSDKAKFNLTVVPLNSGHAIFYDEEWREMWNQLVISKARECLIPSSMSTIPDEDDALACF